MCVSRSYREDDGVVVALQISGIRQDERVHHVRDCGGVLLGQANCQCWAGLGIPRRRCNCGRGLYQGARRHAVDQEGPRGRRRGFCPDERDIGPAAGKAFRSGAGVGVSGSTQRHGRHGGCAGEGVRQYRSLDQPRSHERACIHIVALLATACPRPGRCRVCRCIAAWRACAPVGSVIMTDITRRDFLNGAALTIAAGLTPAEQLAAQPARYPPALTGLRGHHAGSFEAAHELRDGKAFALGRLPIEERYDLVVVGGGISGLAAAWFYRRSFGRRARILVLDNHDDFGGHAKRNEFRLGGRLIIGYGGSESMQSPKALYSAVAKLLIKELGIDVDRFETAFERGLYPSLNLSRGVFFAREAFGRDVLATGDPQAMMSDDIAPEQRNSKPVGAFVAQFPISEDSKAKLIALYDGKSDPLAGKSVEEKLAFLKKTSYRDYLIKTCGCAEEVANCYQGRTLDFYALGIDAVSAADAREAGYPGFEGLGLPDTANPELNEPYIHHFPDGNASIARLLVRALVPGAARGRSMDDIVLARFDYGKLDQHDAPVRIRLESTCVNVRNVRGGVERSEERRVGKECRSRWSPY